MANVTTSNEATKEVKRRNERNGSQQNGGHHHHHSGAKNSSNQPTPPDGGWGVFVVLASFMIHVVTDGMTYSFGVYYLELIYYFDQGKGATAWIASILVGVTLCSGPISGALVNKYGCRTVTIAGSILASICLLISSWAQSVLMLCITIGLGTGLGFGLIYLPAIVSVTCYFEKYRSLATGIAVCGSGLGTIVFAPLCENLITEYGWRGSMMICSALVLNCIVFGALFRPLEPEPEQKFVSEELNRKLSINTTTHVPTKKPERPKSARSNEFNDFQPNVIYRNCEINGKMKMAVSQPILITKISNQQHSETMTKTFGSSGIMNRRDVLYQGSLENIRHQSGFLALKQTDDAENRLCGTLMENPLNHSADGKSIAEYSTYSENTGNVVTEMLNLSLMTDPVFLLFTLSNFCTSIGFNVPYVYLLPQAEKQGIDKAVASYLLAVIGIANTIGRIVLGYVADKPWVNRLLIYNICLTVCGVSTALSAFCTSFGAFAFYCTVYGATAGAYVGLTSVILVDLLGLQRLTNAFGLLLLFQGFASLLGPPIAGWLYDGLGSYDPGFYAAGFMIAISGLMLFFIPMIQKKVQMKEETTIKNITNTHL